MPVQTVKMTGKYLDGRPYEITKPVYWCVCGAMASFGQVVTKGGRKVREWYCGYVDGNPTCVGKGKGNGREQHSVEPTGADQHRSDDGDGVSDRAAGESADLFG